VIPGSLLNRLNPLKDLDAEGRKEFAKKYRAMQAQLDNPADRLTVMDSQGIECAVNYATLPGTEVEFEDDFDGRGFTVTNEVGQEIHLRISDKW